MQSFKRRIATALLCLGICVTVPSGAAVALPAVQSSVLQADMSSGSVVVPVTINGHTLDAVLDTGASHTVVDANVAQTLGLQAEIGLAVGGGVREVRARRAVPVRIDIGSSHFESRPLLMDLAPTGLPQKVIVGRDFFDGHIVEIDFQKSEVRVLDPEAPEASEKGSIPLSQTLTAILSLPVSIGGRWYEGALDLGSQTALAIPAAVLEKLDPKPRRSTWVRGDISGLSVIETATIPEIALAGVVLRYVPAVIDDDPSRADSVTIGLPVLRRYIVRLDLGGRRIWLKPDSDRLLQSFSRDRSGLALEAAADGLRVVHVARGSPAEAQGFSIGDRILAVDDEPVLGDVAVHLRRAGYGAAGQRVTLRTAEGAVRTIILADYY